MFSRRTRVLLFATVVSVGCLALIGWTTSFAVAIGTLVLLELTSSIALPMRQAFLNGLIPSAQRATCCRSTT